MRWEVDAGSDSWDESLSKLGGHPLQSALWGSARRKVDRIAEHRWRAFDGDRLILMARIEERGIPGLGRVAWIPKGPTWGGGRSPEVERVFHAMLKDAGYCLVVTDRWVPTEATSFPEGPTPAQTIWVDLTRGSDALWKALESKARHGVARARRDGIVSEPSGDRHDLEWFCSLCEETEEAKGFRGPGSLDLMAELLKSGGEHALGSLFVARVGNSRAAGALILRCGKTLHYFWGVTDRKFSRGAGEALQWAIMEWGVAKGCWLYDLEGIDPTGNPGVFNFKKKLGGAIVTLEGKRSTPLSWRGVLLDRGRRITGR